MTLHQHCEEQTDFKLLRTSTNPVIGAATSITTATTFFHPRHFDLMRITAAATTISLHSISPTNTTATAAINPQTAILTAAVATQTTNTTAAALTHRTTTLTSALATQNYYSYRCCGYYTPTTAVATQTTHTTTAVVAQSTTHIADVLFRLFTANVAILNPLPRLLMSPATRHNSR